MSRRAMRYLVIAVVAFGLAGAPAAQTLKLPPHEKVVLKNGLTLLLMEKHGVPIVSLAAIVKAGSVADPAGEEGLASVTAGLLRKGTATRSAQKFAEDLDFIGASFTADASVDFTTLSGEFLTKDVDRGLELFSDALLHEGRSTVGRLDLLLRIFVWEASVWAAGRRRRYFADANQAGCGDEVLRSELRAGKHHTGGGG